MINNNQAISSENCRMSDRLFYWFFSYNSVASWRQWPWSGPFVIGATISHRQELENVRTVVGDGLHKFKVELNTERRASLFGTEPKTGTCAICVLSHAQIFKRKTQTTLVFEVTESVMNIVKKRWCVRQTKAGRPGTHITVRFGKNLGNQVKHFRRHSLQIRKTC